MEHKLHQDLDLLVCKVNLAFNTWAVAGDFGCYEPINKNVVSERDVKEEQKKTFAGHLRAACALRFQTRLSPTYFGIGFLYLGFALWDGECFASTVKKPLIILNVRVSRKITKINRFAPILFRGDASESQATFAPLSSENN